MSACALSTDLRDESLAVLANVLSGGQAAGVVDGHIGSRHGRRYVPKTGIRRSRGHFYSIANFNILLNLFAILSS